MTTKDLTYGILILLWLFWTYKALRFTIINRNNGKEFPFYAGAWWLFCVIIPLLALIIWSASNLITTIVENWNTKLI